MKKSTKQITDPAITRSLNAAKKKVIIKPVNTKPDDRVDKEQVMKSFRVSVRTVQYYHASQIIPYSNLDKRIFYYLPAYCRFWSKPNLLISFGGRLTGK